MQNTDNRQNDWLSKAEDALTFAHTAREQFALAVKNKDYKRQRVLIAAFGSNLVLKNKTLSIQAKPLLSTIKEILPAVPDAQEGFEPKEYRANKTQKDQEFTPSPIWLPDQSLILVRLSDQEYLRGITDRLEYIAELQSMAVA